MNILRNIYRFLKKLTYGKINIYKNIPNKSQITSSYKVSVVIPNYNYAKYIIERIDSIINQTYPIYELIILDDKSTDNSVDVINKKIKSINIPVKFIINEENSGNVFKQWNKGFKEATGDYVWIAEADDSSNPYFLETIMKKMDNDIVLAYADSKRIDDNNKVLYPNCKDLKHEISSIHFNDDYIIDGKNEVENYMSIACTIINVSSVIWKKQNYEKLFLEATNFKIAGDWYIYTNVINNGKLLYISNPLNYYRKHNNSVSSNIEKEIEEIRKIHQYINNNFDINDEIKKKQDEYLNRRVVNK